MKLTEEVIREQEKVVTYLNAVCQRGKDYSPFTSLETAQERRDREEDLLVAMRIERARRVREGEMV